MLVRNITFSPRYSTSHALLIGINDYANAGRLAYALNDATEVSKALIDALHFPPANITLLVDRAATREAIMTALHSVARRTMPDDRLVVFFAGHGHTVTGHRGEIGFLVPVDGRLDDLSTLLRWDEITKVSEVVPAKHALFVMDACYGGLALMRVAKPGSMRFLQDMLRRFTRQVITAGKADELVADAGGPRPGHSVFTGHFLDAIEGAARTEDGVITASNVMAYVYDKVAKDYASRQTPHFGHLDGDGDMVLAFGTALQALPDMAEIESDVLVEVTTVDNAATSSAPVTLDIIKEYLADTRYRIRLDDVVSEELRRVLEDIAPARLPLETAGLAPQDVVERLQHYEAACSRLLDIVGLLGCWAEGSQRPALKRAVVRLADFERVVSGKVIWIGLRWYPALLSLYVAGIAALHRGELENLVAIFTATVSPRHTGQEPLAAAVAIVDGILEADQYNVFKHVPGHERHFVPRSEYLFKTLQPKLEDLFFLGNTYEPLFDRFEMLLALTYMDLRDRTGGGAGWAPIGRYGWKNANAVDGGPLAHLAKEAQQLQGEWPPLRAGLFAGSYDRLTTALTQLQRLSAQRQWW